MRTSDFIANSDYLGMALVNSQDFTSWFGTGTPPFEGSRTFTTKKSPGALDMYRITFNGTTIVTSGTATIRISTNAVAFLTFIRTSETTIRMDFQFDAYAAQSGSWPEITFGIHVDSFVAPNTL